MGGQAMTVGLDTKVLAKLIVAAAAATLGTHAVLTDYRVRDVLLTLPALLILSICGLAIAASATAISSAAAPTALINSCYVAFAATAMVRLRWAGIQSALLTGCCLTCSLALSLYFFAPDWGRFPEQLPGGLIVYRLGGTAHPNSVGRSAVIGMMMLATLWDQRRLPAAAAAALTVLLGSVAYLAWSRTAIGAGALGLLIYYGGRIDWRVWTGGAVTAVTAGLIGLTLLVGSGREDNLVGRVLEKLSKTGDAEEITSGTGRGEIWSYASGLIARRPLLGYGFTAAPTLMVNHSQSTHNVVLHASLSAGVLAGAVMVGLLIWNAVVAFGSSLSDFRALSGLLLIACLTEEAVLETFPGPCTLAWLAVSIYPVTGLRFGWRPRKSTSSPAVDSRRYPGASPAGGAVS